MSQILPFVKLLSSEKASRMYLHIMMEKYGVKLNIDPILLTHEQVVEVIVRIVSEVQRLEIEAQGGMTISEDANFEQMVVH